LPAFIRSELPSDLLDHMREDVENTARAALEAFSDRAKQGGVPVETVMLDLARGDITNEVSRLARYFDAAVLQQPHPAGAGTADLIEAVLFGSGRPGVDCPLPLQPVTTQDYPHRMGRGAPRARAVADAMPLLAMAERVEVVTVGHQRGDQTRHSSTMVRHLAGTALRLI
jgi:hypothetical protein